MLRKNFFCRQFQNQVWKDSIGYSSAFSSSASDWNIASSAYSSAHSAAVRRKWPREKNYKDKLRIINGLARRSIGVDKP